MLTYLSRFLFNPSPDVRSGLRVPQIQPDRGSRRYSGHERSTNPKAQPEEPCPLHGSDSFLHRAAYKGDVLTLTSLTSSCDNVDALSYYGCTALHLAIRGNHAGAVTLLLSAGADPLLEDNLDSALQLPQNAMDWCSASHGGSGRFRAEDFS